MYRIRQCKPKLKGYPRKLLKKSIPNFHLGNQNKTNNCSKVIDFRITKKEIVCMIIYYNKVKIAILEKKKIPVQCNNAYKLENRPLFFQVNHVTNLSSFPSHRPLGVQPDAHRPPPPGLLPRVGPRVDPVAALLRDGRTRRQHGRVRAGRLSCGQGPSPQAFRKYYFRDKLPSRDATLPTFCLIS